MCNRMCFTAGCRHVTGTGGGYNGIAITAPLGAGREQSRQQLPALPRVCGAYPRQTAPHLLRRRTARAKGGRCDPSVRIKPHNYPALSADGARCLYP